MNSTEIIARIEQVKKNEVTNTKKLESLQQERARLALNMADTKKIDIKIEDVRKDVSSTPHELRLLQGNLTAAQGKEAQAERDVLLKQQKKAAKDIEQLCEQFIEALQVAKNINEQLRLALSAESGLAQKTGQQVLGDYCHGSQESLARLLSLMKYQLAGHHTAEIGAGIIPDTTPLRL